MLLNRNRRGPQFYTLAVITGAVMVYLLVPLFFLIVLSFNSSRWLAFPPAVIALMLAGLVASILLLNTFEDSWIAIPAVSLGTCVAVYSGSRIAPSRRRLAIVLASILIVGASLFLLSLTAEGDREAHWGRL